MPTTKPAKNSESQPGLVNASSGFFDRLSCLLTVAIKQTESASGGAKEPALF
jgi:hypothetical protein